MIIAQDFERGVSIAALNPATGADIDNLIDLLSPKTKHGLILVSQDTAVDVPDVPDATATPKWIHYCWIRLPHADDTDRTIQQYAWNADEANTIDTLLYWHETGADFAAIEADLVNIWDQIALTQGTANNAQDLAGQANEAAAAAVITANDAKATADTANTTANTAITNAAAAQASANTAQQSAINANAAVLAKRSAVDVLNAGPTSGSRIRTNSAGTLIEYYTEDLNYVKIEEQYASGAAVVNGVGGTNTRALNATIQNMTPASYLDVVGHKLYLATGTYKFRATIPCTTGAGLTLKHCGRVTVFTDAGVPYSNFIGNVAGSDTQFVTTNSEVMGMLVIPNGAYYIQVFTDASANNILCNNGALGENNVGAQLELTKIV